MDTFLQDNLYQTQGLFIVYIVQRTPLLLILSRILSTEQILSIKEVLIK